MIRKSILFIILFTASQFGVAQRIAIATKAIGTVEINKKAQPGYNSLKAGTILEDGDGIRTGSDGFVLLIFIDDKSQLKVKGDSEVTISGKKIASAISKNIRMDNGTVRAEVNKQRKGEFVIQSTTSVASVKGTDFWFIANSEDGDMVIGLEGIVDLFNANGSKALESETTGKKEAPAETEAHIKNSSSIVSPVEPSLNMHKNWNATLIIISI